MRIVIDRPPNYDKINAAFNIAGLPVIFAYGDTIYNPGNGEVTRSLIEHELTHCIQQADSPEAWWDLYIESPDFRFTQELAAHRAEFDHYRKRHVGKRSTRYLEHCASKFSSPVYGNIVTHAQARHAILTGEMP